MQLTIECKDQHGETLFFAQMPTAWCADSLASLADSSIVATEEADFAEEPADPSKVDPTTILLILKAVEAVLALFRRKKPA